MIFIFKNPKRFFTYKCSIAEQKSYYSIWGDLLRCVDAYKKPISLGEIICQFRRKV